MDKNIRKIIILFITIIILLLFNVIYNILFIIDFSKQKENGNEKWHVVEERIVNVEKQIEEITKEKRY
mgnify:FL=1|jgi:hypothetical protein